MDQNLFIWFAKHTISLFTSKTSPSLCYSHSQQQWASKFRMSTGQSNCTNNLDAFLSHISITSFYWYQSQWEQESTWQIHKGLIFLAPLVVFFFQAFPHPPAALRSKCGRKRKKLQLPSQKRKHLLILGRLTLCVKHDIGWTIKKCSIKVKKKCTKKVKMMWPCRKLKTWYRWNNIMVFLFAKKYFSYFDLYSWYGHLNVKFLQIWHLPNVFKFCSKTVFCLYFPLPKKFYYSKSWWC